MKLLRRTPKTEPDADAIAEAPAEDGEQPEPMRSERDAPRGYTPGKGRATPKRRDAAPRPPRAAEPPPATRREAYRRMKGRNSSSRGRGGGKVAGERPLPARDQGPEKALVRDVVDSRRNIGSSFLFVAVVVFIAYLSGNATLRAWAISAWLAIFVLIIVDSFLLSGRVRKLVGQRFPDARVRGLGWYAIQRSTMIRRWRLPKARVKPGATI